MSTYTQKNSKVEIKSPGLVQVRLRVGIGLEEGGLSREVQGTIPGNPSRDGIHYRVQIREF